jgi:hypothetical protein
MNKKSTFYIFILLKTKKGKEIIKITVKKRMGIK